MTSAEQAQQPATEIDSRTIRRAIAAAAMGNGMEWFDFGVYSYVAVTIGQVFFPPGGTALHLIETFATFAVAFLIRPFGGLFFGPLGDRIGRRRVLAATMIMMAVSTFAIGILPTYAMVGPLAPVLLVLARLVQGFSTGGEYGGAATFIAEYAPDRRRGFFCSFLESGTLSGFVLGASIVTALQASLSHADMTSWGWRIPFLVAGPIGIIGLYLRTRLEDTPAFQRLEGEGEVAKSPLKETLLHSWRPILLCVGLIIVYNVVDYTVLSYMPTYLSQVLHMSETAALLTVLAAMVLMIAVINQIGRLSDRVGRKPILVIACLGVLVLSYPCFALMSLGNPVLTLSGLAVLGTLLVLMLGTMSATLPALFSTKVRYGSFAIGYNVGTSLFGGTAPLVISALINWTHNGYIPAYYMMGAAVISLVPILLIVETARRPLKGSAPSVAVSAAGARAKSAPVAAS